MEAGECFVLLGMLGYIFAHVRKDEDGKKHNSLHYFSTSYSSLLPGSGSMIGIYCEFPAQSMANLTRDLVRRMAQGCCPKFSGL